MLPEVTGMDGHEAGRGTDSLGRVRPGLQTHGRQAVSVGFSPSRTFQREWPRELGEGGTCPSKLQAKTTRIWPRPPCSEFRGTRVGVQPWRWGSPPSPPVSSQLKMQRPRSSREGTVSAGDPRLALGRPRAAASQGIPRTFPRGPPANTGQSRGHAVLTCSPPPPQPPYCLSGRGTLCPPRSLSTILWGQHALLLQGRPRRQGPPHSRARCSSDAL